LGKGRKEEGKNSGIKESPKSMTNIIFQNNTVIRIFAIELLNTTLLFVFNDKISP
jgi:hypothetical protein